MISAMLDDIVMDNSAEAQEKFNTLVSQRVAAALDDRKVDIAASVYPKEPNENATHAQS